MQSLKNESDGERRRRTAAARATPILTVAIVTAAAVVVAVVTVVAIAPTVIRAVTALPVAVRVKAMRRVVQVIAVGHGGRKEGEGKRKGVGRGNKFQNWYGSLTGF